MTVKGLVTKTVYEPLLLLVLVTKTAYEPVLLLVLVVFSFSAGSFGGVNVSVNVSR